MAEWNNKNIMLTSKGAQALAKVETGTGYLTITRAVGSSQVLDTSKLSLAEDVPSAIELPIISREESGDGGSIIQLQLTNIGVTEPFVLNEVGVYAKHSSAPDTEFLYIIAQADTGTGDRVPAYSVTPVTATYDIYLYNLKDSDITVPISASGLATVTQMNAALLAIKSDEVHTSSAYGASGGTATALTLANDSDYPFSLKEGSAVKLKLSLEPDEGATLNVADTGAFPIVNLSGSTISKGSIAKGIVLFLLYNGSQWVVQGGDAMNLALIDKKVETSIANSSEIALLKSRVNQVEIEESNILMKMEANNDCPNSNLVMYEDLKNPSKIDQFLVKVTSIAAGSNAVDIATLKNVLPGAYYTLSDGVTQEVVQIKSCIRNGSVLRVLTTANIVGNFTVADTYLYRTTTEIESGVAYGSGDKKGFNWTPNTTWKGATSSTQVTQASDTSQSNSDSFTNSNEITYTSDGKLSIVPTTVTGISLISSSGGAGTWTTYEGEAE